MPRWREAAALSLQGQGLPHVAAPIQHMRVHSSTAGVWCGAASCFACASRLTPQGARACRASSMSSEQGDYSTDEDASAAAVRASCSLSCCALGRPCALMCACCAATTSRRQRGARAERRESRPGRARAPRLACVRGRRGRLAPSANECESMTWAWGGHGLRGGPCVAAVAASARARARRRSGRARPAQTNAAKCCRPARPLGFPKHGARREIFALVRACPGAPACAACCNVQCPWQSWRRPVRGRLELVRRAAVGRGRGALVGKKHASKHELEWGGIEARGASHLPINEIGPRCDKGCRDACLARQRPPACARPHMPTPSQGKAPARAMRARLA